MPIYNDHLFLDMAIQSILEQTYNDFEFIICDDGSTNGKTLEIINKYLHDKRIVFVQNQKNLGLPSSLNKCISIARGKYIARMDGDDISKRVRFDKQVAYLEKNKNVGAVSSFADIIDENDTNVGLISNPLIPSFKEVLEKVRFVHPASMFRKEALISVGMYSTEPEVLIGRCEDYDLWCRLYENGAECHNLEESLILYREVSDSYKKRKRKAFKYSRKVKKSWMKKHKEAHPSKKVLIISFVQRIIPSRIAFALHKRKLKKSKNKLK